MSRVSLVSIPFSRRTASSMWKKGVGTTHIRATQFLLISFVYSFFYMHMCYGKCMLDQTVRSPKKLIILLPESTRNIGEIILLLKYKIFM